MQITTQDAPKPRGSWQQQMSRQRARNSYRHRMREALKAISDLRPREGDSVSALAITLALTRDGTERATTREAVGDAFQALTDMGIVAPVLTNGRRTTTLFDFGEDFGPEQMDELIAWNGLARVDKGSARAH